MDLLSTADVAKLLDLSSDTVRVLARSGRLQPATRSARGVRIFSRSEVEAPNKFLGSEHSKQLQKICEPYSRAAPTEHFPSQGWDDPMRAVVALQQSAGALDDGVESRSRAEAALRHVTAERELAAETLRGRDEKGRSGLRRGSDFA